MERVLLYNVERQLVSIMLKNQVSPDSQLWKDLSGLVDVVKLEQRKIDNIKESLTGIISKL